MRPLQTIQVPNNDVIHVMKPLQETTFCCGGQELYVFTNQGKMVGATRFHSPDMTFHTLLVLQHSRAILGVMTESCDIIAVPLEGEGAMATYVQQDAGDQPYLSTKVLKAEHKQPVTLLADINDTLFASACKGGSVVLWMSRTLTICRTVVPPHPSPWDEARHLFVCPVAAVTPLSDTYLAVARKEQILVVCFIVRVCVTVSVSVSDWLRPARGCILTRLFAARTNRLT